MQKDTCFENSLRYLFNASFNQHANNIGLKIKHGFFHRDDKISGNDYFSKFNNFYAPILAHGDKIFHLQEKDLNQSIIEIPNRMQVYQLRQINPYYQADAIITNLSNTKICVLSSDCVPILGYCSKTKFIFAIHSGWKGSISNIFENLLLKLKELTGSNKEDSFDLHFIIGPSIFFESYEFGSKKMNEILRNKPNYEKFFIKENNKIFFDIRSLIEFRLSALTKNKIEKIEIDTFLSSEFTSFRRKILNLKKENPNVDLSNIKSNSFISFIEKTE